MILLSSNCQITIFDEEGERMQRGYVSWSSKEFLQGTVVFSIERATPFSVVIKPLPATGSRHDDEQCCKEQWLSLEVNDDTACFKLRFNGETKTLCDTGQWRGACASAAGLEPGTVTSYWLSYDSHNMVLKYGKGYVMNETTILEHSFLKGMCSDEQALERRRLGYLFSHDIPRVIELLEMLNYSELVSLYCDKLHKGMTFGCKKQSLSDIDTIRSTDTPDNMAEHHDTMTRTLAESLIDVTRKVEIRSRPLVTNLSPLVLDSSKTTLFHLDSHKYTLSASLPSTCKELYQNVAHDGVCLDTPLGSDERYALSDAIRHSLQSPNGILNKKLQEKVTKGCGNKKEAANEGYLRVTLGGEYGNSPGIPYVLEVWPSGYGSPIHRHGDSYAVIKVLHGGLTIHIYNKGVQDYGEQPLLSFDVGKGDITWIDPNWYQTHRLWNGTDDYCATIQCYNYGEEDSVRCPHFHYISGSGAVGDFVPNSDFSFHEMRECVMKEYETYMHST